MSIILRRFKGTPFQRLVWAELLKIKSGEVISYKELAKRIGKPSAVRAVANAVSANPVPIKIPCHRVIRSDGTIGGYSGSGGVNVKKALLKKEGVIF